MKAIVFGCNGQDGYYLTKLLNKKNIEVIAVNRPESQHDTDITDYKSVSSLVRAAKPDFIFHFAADSTTKHDAIFDNDKVISLGTINILEAVKNFSPTSRVFISGSGLQFENQGRPISESDAFQARDPYSMSRIHSVYAARYYRKFGLKIYIGYFFTHDSPRRTEIRVAKKITNFVSQIDKWGENKLLLGNIDVIKEWTFAADTVEAVYMFVNQDQIFEAVIGSGIGYSIKEFVEVAFSEVGKDWNDYVSVQTNFTPEYNILVSNPSLIFSLGWHPRTSMQELACMMIHEVSE
jgi:GDPmannose 4,6-dehydratase